MPGIPTPEDQDFITKIALYIVGTILGIGAKLASMHRVKPVTIKDVIINSTVAFAAAYLVYALLVYTGHTSLATISSVICGRFADDVLQLAWKAFKTLIKTTNDDLNPKQ